MTRKRCQASSRDSDLHPGRELSKEGPEDTRKKQVVMIENNQVTAYKVNPVITFVLEEGEAPASAG